MRGVKILTPGVLATIQDRGRPGYREFGLPLAGVMDRESADIANWLVSNSPGEALIEATYHGLKAEFLSSCLVALTGADMNPTLSGRRLKNWRAYRAKRGDILELEGPPAGIRCYIALSGGFRIEPVLGSCSTYIPGSVGGFRGRELRKDDIIPLYPSAPLLHKRRELPEFLLPPFPGHASLRVLPGVDFGKFSPGAISTLLSATYSVTPRSDRMGIRLSGPAVDTSGIGDIISYPVHPGVVQVPPGGEPIIMGSDSQTTGGYPQPFVIVSADLDLAGRLRPGGSVSFELTEPDKAIRLSEDSRERKMLITGKGKAKVCTDCAVKRR